MTGNAGGEGAARTADDGQGGRRIFANFSYLFMAQAVGALAGLVSTAWLARALGADAYGMLGFGTAILAYFGLITAAGTDVYGMREIAQTRGAITPILRGILGLRATLLMVALLLYLFAVRAMDFDDALRRVLWIQGFGLIATAFTLDFVFQGVQRMGAVAARQVLASLLVLAGVLLLVRTPGDVHVAAAIPVCAMLLAAGWLAWQAHRQVAPLAFSFDVAQWRSILVASLPILVAQGVNAIYTHMDIVMLGLMAGTTETGLYFGMARLYAMAVLVGGLLGAVFSPVLAAAWKDTQSMRTRYRDFLTVCMFAGAPIAAAGIAWPAEIIAIVFGSEFLPGTRSLVLLMATALLTYATFPVAAALLTWHDQKTQMLLMAAGGLVNIGLNLVLIPRYGMDGAAAATLVSQAFLLIALLLRLRVRFGLWELGPAAGIAAIAGLVFALVVALSRMLAGWVPGPPWLSLFLYAVIGGLVYCGVVAALGLVEPGRLLRLARGARGENPL